MPEILAYEADGLRMRSTLFLPEGRAHGAPGVLVFPEAYGLSPHAVARAERLAGMGYAALACDIHGEAHLEDDLGRALELLKPLYADPRRTRARGGLGALLARPEVDGARVAAIGFCFGGTMALEFARDGAALRAAVGVHSGLGTADPVTGPGRIAARVLVCISADDPMIDADQRTRFEGEMRAAEADWQMHLYGGTVHSVTNREAARRARPDALRYSADADRRSWAPMTALFDEALA